MPKTETIQIRLDPDADEYTEVVLRQAIVEDGILKQTLEKKAKSESAIERTIEYGYYPTCVSCVASPKHVREMSFEQFANLLDQDVENWALAALRLNHHWNNSIAPLEKQKWDIEDWLREGYDNPGAEEGLMPPFEEKVFILGRVDDDLLAYAKKVLTILELTEWRWTILDVLRQPEELLDVVFYMKNIGEKFRTQARNRKKKSNNG
jgi:hypothetical protein